MYHPYFRGKQFELITIRETAPLLATARFVPIIEPVRESLGGLEKALKAVCDAGGSAVVIVNPYHGDHREGGVGISSLLDKGFLGSDAVAAGVLLKKDMTPAEAIACYDQHKGHKVTFVHAGFTEAKALAETLGGDLRGARNVFFEAYCGKLYRKHFLGSMRILLRDGFTRQRNADYPLLEEFSDLHVTYGEEGMDAFGDFLVVGDDYTESGGPAYAVAIHLTFIDPDKDDAMYIYHFVSTTKDTPTDPAGKFGEALRKLIAKLDSGASKLLETSAISEFRELHAKGHFPGLGYVKKLSPETATAEIRPHTGEIACVADFTIPEIRAVDLRNPRKLVSPFILGDASVIGQLRADLPFLERLGDELTRPVLPQGAAIDYIPSQYLCEFIKKSGYDGVVYRSSVSDGINLALFDPTKAAGGAVALYNVTRVAVEVARA